MEVNAKVAKNENQIRIMKKMSSGMFRISVADAKHLHKTGRITKSNKAFKRLVADDFDTAKTLAWYQAERERLAKEKSATDEG